MFASEEDFHTCIHTWKDYLSTHKTSKGVTGIQRDSQGYYTVLRGESSEYFDWWSWLGSEVPPGMFGSTFDIMKAFDITKSRGLRPKEQPEVILTRPPEIKPNPLPEDKKVEKYVELEVHPDSDEEEGATGFLTDRYVSKVLLSNLSTREVVELEGNSIVLGRSSRSSSHSVSKDITLSRKHCLLEKGTDGSWTVMDLGSSNGTWLGATRLEPNHKYPILSGSLLRLGGVSFTVNLD